MDLTPEDIKNLEEGYTPITPEQEYAGSVYAMSPYLSPEISPEQQEAYRLQEIDKRTPQSFKDLYQACTEVIEISDMVNSLEMPIQMSNVIIEGAMSAKLCKVYEGLQYDKLATYKYAMGYKRWFEVERLELIGEVGNLIKTPEQEKEENDNKRIYVM